MWIMKHGMDRAAVFVLGTPSLVTIDINYERRIE
jgi:hypothetical protein